MIRSRFATLLAATSLRAGPHAGSENRNEATESSDVEIGPHVAMVRAGLRLAPIAACSVAQHNTQKRIVHL
jgi:hypothetical protein